MFYYLYGKLAFAEPAMAVLDVGGVGYKLTISGTTYSALPRTTSEPEVKLFTHMAVREDDVELFGFFSEEELSAFKLLISVSGVGPKAAMAILTLLTPEKFALAVCTEDTKTLAKASGVGSKTAARIVLELKDKMSKEAPAIMQASGDASVISSTAGAGAAGKLSEAIDALTVLGYSRPEAMSAIKGLDTEKLPLEEIIRLSLKKLMRP